MDIFKFINPLHPTRMEEGEIINGIRSKLWIERYRLNGEFELVANVSSGLHLKLPIGTFISHTESTEIMMVENHEITESKNTPTDVKISGRSFDSFFENRIVGSNKSWPTITSITEEYSLAADYTWNQAVRMIQDHVDTTMVFDFDDGIPYLEVSTDVVGTGESEPRSIKRGPLYSRLIELLEINNLGVKVIRPSLFSPSGMSPGLSVVIHSGENLSQDVAFSYNTGEIESADYFWSNRNVKNAALITGRWLETVAKLSPAGYNRRMMEIDASDLDGGYDTAPTGTTKDAILLAMFIRGVSVLAAQNPIALIKVEPSRESVNYKYRADYSVGDIVGVNGSYNESANMRVSEYVEIEDETGESGYPTLSLG